MIQTQKDLEDIQESNLDLQTQVADLVEESKLLQDSKHQVRALFQVLEGFCFFLGGGQNQCTLFYILHLCEI